ncbi:MAG: hypothetical protein JF629_18665 [Variovorax paradoxus]|nr:hypothetical protein [Variovorax paradoxus]MBW8717785.1 hypothetical protein [Variovorax paradoxus]
MALAYQRQHGGLHALGQALAAPARRHGRQLLVHAVRKALVPAGVAHGGHLVAVEQQHQKVLSAALRHVGIPGAVVLELVAHARHVQRIGGRVVDERREGRDQAGQALEGHAAGVDFGAQAPAGGECLRLPAGEFVPRQCIEGGPVLDGAVLLDRADGWEKRMPFGQVGLDAGSGLALRFHEAEQHAQQCAGHAAPPVRPQYTAPGIEIGREGGMVRRAFAAKAQREAADELAFATREDPVEGQQRQVLTQRALGVGAGDAALAGVVFLGAKLPIAMELLPAFGGRLMGIENGYRKRPRMRGAGFKHGEP